jgi:predicted permease
MEIPLIKGRFFDDRDTEKATQVAIVDETFARRFWADGDAVGKRLKQGGPEANNPWVTIVGVVGDVRQYSLDAVAPRVAVYEPDSQNPDSGMYLVLRTDGNTSGVASAAKAEVQAMDPNVPLFDVKMMDKRLSESLARRRFSMLLLLVFAGVALFLATVGIYGVVSYSVTQRSHEIGVRMALGAQRQDVLRMMVVQGMKPALVGLGTGLAAAFILTRFMAGLLFGVSATDASSFAGIPLLLGAVGFMATYIPARRATRVEPMVSLHYE